METKTELPTISMDEVKAIPTWVVTSLKDVDIQLLITCPIDLYRRLEFAATVIQWAAKLTGLKVTLTVAIGAEL